MVELGHMATAVLAFGDFAFEGRIVDRMIFHLHRHALDLRVVTGPLGHGPTLQRVPYLKAEVIVPPAGMVQLHHENGALPFR